MFSELSTPHIRRELGDRLRAHRKVRRLSQQALADRAGISRPTLSSLERGHEVTLDSLISVLRALDLLDTLDAALASPPQSPIEALGGGKKSNRHARPSWTWGDES